MNNILDVCSELRFGETGVEFIGKGNVWINNDYEDAVTYLARYVISEAIDRTAPGQLSIIGYDSDLSGIFAPFASLSAGESRTMELLNDYNEFKKYLDYMWQQIQSVQNVIQGRTGSLLEFREMTQRPVEGYTLVVLSMDMGLIDNETRAKLGTLMTKGPSYGLSFLIISTTIMSIQTRSGRDIELSTSSIAPNITVVEAFGRSVTVGDSNEFLPYIPYSADDVIQKCERYITESRTAQLPVVRFDEINDTDRLWGESSIEGLTFSIGKFGINNMDITIGDEVDQRHNVVITGAVGQGKSNLISAIIHSLCQRYSPDELQLYLLDFKEGVSLKAFSNIGQTEYLPHARALGLESDVSFGMAVLTYLYKEYQNRMKLLKEYNYKSIRELRTKRQDICMPRIVVVIDEFQMMFGDDLQGGQKIVDLLEKSVRLFRAAGIHFILASQTLGGNIVLAQKKDSIFSQVPVRIALKNSIAESMQTLGMNNPAAAFLRPREAVVNLDYGEISQNRKTVIAFADEKDLTPLRHVWWEKMHDRYSAPYVFISDQRIGIGRHAKELKHMRESGRRVAAILGDMISIGGEHIDIPMSPENGRNIAVIGTPDGECNNAVGILQGAALSLASQYPAGKARFIFCDFADYMHEKKPDYMVFSEMMGALGHRLEKCLPSEFDGIIKELTANPVPDTFVIGSGMDRWEYEKDPYGSGSPLKEFAERGPFRGMHFIGWWVKASAFTSQVAGYGSTDAFNTKVFLRIDERAVQAMCNPFVRWAPQENRALISDYVEYDEELVFIPFAPVEEDDKQEFMEIL